MIHQAHIAVLENLYALGRKITVHVRRLCVQHVKSPSNASSDENERAVVEHATIAKGGDSRERAERVLLKEQA